MVNTQVQSTLGFLHVSNMLAFFLDVVIVDMRIQRYCSQEVGHTMDNVALRTAKYQVVGFRYWVVMLEC